jgi:processing peptidase subunit beta
MKAFRNIIKPVKRPLLYPSNRNIVSALKQKLELPETKVTTLPSGFRVASETTPLSTATVGVWIDAGSRYENEINNGAAHFLEHMAFKGTNKRSQWGLELEVENMGAHLNAYTSREQTVYYAKCFSNDLEPAVEILSDILLHSVYGKQEIERERGVILREMEEVEQNLQEVVFDFLHMHAFRGTSLSRTILGPEENIKSLTRDDLVGYVQKYYKGPRMVLAGAGGVNHDELVKLADKYFGIVDSGENDILSYEAGKFSETYNLIQNEDMDCVYGCLAVEGTSWTHHDNLPMQVLNTIIGQFDRSQAAGLLTPSRLAQRISHTAGINSYLSFTTNYKDMGLAGVYFSAEPSGLQTICEAICNEWQTLCHSVTQAEVDRAKRWLFTNMLLMLDGSTPICEDIGRQLLCYGRRITIPELEARINAITVDTIQSVCQKYFVNKPIACTIIGRTQNWPDLDKIKSMLTY